MEKIKVAVLGGGNMGASICQGILNKTENDITVCDSNLSQISRFEGKCELICDYHEIKSPDVLVLALKPQVIRNLKDLSSIKAKLIISIAAGITINELEHIFPESPIVRFMPNLAASKGASCTAVAFNSLVDEKGKDIASEIASCIGKYYLLDEKEFDAFIGISASGIAFILEAVNALSLAGVQEGFQYNKATEIVRDTLLSVASVLDDPALSPAVLETRVCSPMGTTIEGVRYLKENSFEGILMGAATAAAEKSKELGRR